MSAIERRFDALVIGSGAAGSIAVKELTERGMEVLMLEAGRDLTEEDFTPEPAGAVQAGIGLGPRLRAALAGQPVQARRAFFKSSMSPFLVDDRDNPYTTPRGQFFLWIRGRILGGRLNSYGRMLMRRSDWDFGACGRDGHGIPWPLTYADLAPYYDRVEELIGIYGNADGIPQVPDGKYVGPAKLTAVELAFKERIQQRWPERSVISWRYAAPNPERVPRGILAARATGRLTARTDAVVTQITVDGRTGHADGAVFVDRLSKRQHRVAADVVVLCASAIESVRLMFNSACARHPDGLGNSSGLLGRYFMDQTPNLAFGSDPSHRGYWEADESAPLDDFYGAAGGVYVPSYVDLDGQPDPGFSRGFGFQGTMGRFPVPENRGAAIGMMGFGEMLPTYANRVTINSRRKDAWGAPVPHISVSMTDNDRRLLRAQVQAVREMWEECGYQIDFIASPLGLDAKDVLPDADPISRFVFRRGVRKSLALGAAIHECGGARMGSDPATSVLNEFNQTWDIPNLFVTDGACFPSTGTVGQALTIMALTARACDYIAREHANGALAPAAAS